MSKRVLIISSSPRKNGNSDTLCHSFAHGAKENGNEVIEIFTNNKEIHYCKGCGYCSNHDSCCQHDDMAEIIDEIMKSDVIIFSSPIYFYSISGQLKTLIDRLVAVYTKISSKEMYYIFAAAENGKNTFSRAAACIDGLCDCLSNVQVKGIIAAGGVWNKGAVDNTKYIQQAYDMGYAV